MPVSLSIKDVPDHLAVALRERARRNHRSIQGELMAMLEDLLRPAAGGAILARERASAFDEAAVDLRRPPFNARSWRYIPGGTDAEIIIRQMRDERDFTITDLYEYVRSLGAPTPEESVAWLREARESR